MGRLEPYKPNRHCGYGIVTQCYIAAPSPYFPSWFLEQMDKYMLRLPTSAFPERMLVKPIELYVPHLSPYIPPWRLIGVEFAIYVRPASLPEPFRLILNDYFYPSMSLPGFVLQQIPSCPGKQSLLHSDWTYPITFLLYSDWINSIQFTWHAVYILIVRITWYALTVSC